MAAFGYRFGLRQPLFKIALIVSLPEESFSDAFDKWMLEALEVNQRDYSPRFIGKATLDKATYTYLKRLLHITNTLLQDIRIPIFERAAIEAVDLVENSDNKRVTLWLPILHGFSEAIILRWLSIANELMHSVSRCHYEAQVTQRIYEEFGRKHLSPWVKRVAGAKSTVPVLQAAWAMGIPFEHLTSGHYLLGWGRQSQCFDRSSNDKDSAIGAKLTHRKDHALQLMRQAGIPVPTGYLINSSTYDCSKITLPPPWVVKPVDGDRGEGVTVGIMDVSHLNSAISEAAKISNTVLIEEQISGTCHRILVAEGRIVFVVRRNPRSVIGDGHSTIQSLVDNENRLIDKKIPIKRLPLLRLDEEAKKILAAIGMTVESIPKKGQKIELRGVQSAIWGGDPEVLTEFLHPENAALAIRSARLFNLSCAGVDFISTDISQPWHKTGAVINEINYAPVLGRTHLYQREGIQKYLAILFPNQGKIPIEVFIGTNIEPLIYDRASELSAKGGNPYICNDLDIINYQGMKIQLTNGIDIFSRVAMLRTERDMGSLIVYINHDDSFIRHGLPFEYITRLVVSPRPQLTQQQLSLLAMLEDYLPSSQSIEYV